MDTPISHVLKIADTPADTEAGNPPDVTPTAPVPHPDRPSSSKGKKNRPRKHRGNGTTRRCTPAEMAIQMAIVDHANGHGRPTIYRGS